MVDKVKVGDTTRIQKGNRECRDDRAVLLKKNLKGRNLKVAKTKVSSQVGRTGYMGTLDPGIQRLIKNLSFLVRKDSSLSPSFSKGKGSVEGSETGSSKELEVIKDNKEPRFLVLPNLSGSKGYVYPPREGLDNNKLEQLEVLVPLSSIFNPEKGGWLARILKKGRIDESPFMDNSELFPSFEQELSKKRPAVQRRLLIPEVFRYGALPQEEFSFDPIRLTVIIEAVMEEGLTEYSAKVLGWCHRKSTIRQYQSVWAKFLDFLDCNNIEHWDVKGRDIVNFLSFYARKGRAYKTLAVYKNALRLPLLFKLGLNMESQMIKSFMRGMFRMIPPSLDDRMPEWDVNIVLKWLLSKEFCPPEKAPFIRLEQKLFFLFLIGTSRRLHEICNLSLDYKRILDRVLLYWVPHFRAKNHNEDHSPAPPSIKRMTHYVKDKKELNNCPVRNWEVYLKRRLNISGNNSVYLWTRSQALMCASLKLLVMEAYRKANIVTEVAVRPHQVKKVSISLCGKYWERAKELRLESLTGNKSYSTLERYYLKKTIKLRLACSLPLGTAPPKED